MTNHDATVHYLTAYNSVLISSELVDLIQVMKVFFFFFCTFILEFKFTWCEVESSVPFCCLFFSMCVLSLNKSH